MSMSATVQRRREGIGGSKSSNILVGGKGGESEGFGIRKTGVVDNAVRDAVGRVAYDVVDVV